MKRDRMLLWTITAASLFLLSLIILKWSGSFWVGSIHGLHEYGRAGFRHHDGFVRAPYMVSGLAIVFILIKLGVLALSLVLWAKAEGLLKWSGAIFASLTLMSLFTPFWGLLMTIGLVLLGERLKKNKISSRGATTVYHPADNRGFFLDEWEHKQLKEEK